VQLRKVHAGVGAYREFDAFATFFDKLDAHFIDAARARLLARGRGIIVSPAPRQTVLQRDVLQLQA
jgi:hypothetical protein